MNVNRVSIERRENIDSKDPNILHIGAGNHSDLVIFKNAQSRELNKTKCVFIAF